MSKKCKHKNCELSGHVHPGMSDDYLFISELKLTCLDCGTRLVTRPKDLKHIRNIPHPKPENCAHPDSVRSYNVGYGGGATCLQCGEYFAPVVPTTKLDITAELENE